MINLEGQKRIVVTGVGIVGLNRPCFRRQTLLAALGCGFNRSTVWNRLDIAVTNAYATMNQAYEDGSDPVTA